MAVDERDVRMILVAFEDATTWCETLADLTDDWIETARRGEPITAEALENAVKQVAETRRFLQADRSEVRRIIKRDGLV
jgi:N-acetylglucosamine kinase-like BadF-type ATPase